MNILKLYICGYLNVYYVNYFELLEKSDKTYKEYKLSKLAAYLNLPSWLNKFLLRVFLFLLIVEIPYSLILTTLRFVRSFVICLFTPFEKIENENVLIGAGEVKTKHLLSTTDLNIETIKVVLIPYISSNIYSDLNTISIYSGIRCVDVVHSYWKSLKTIFVICRKYHNRDFLTRSYSSFEYYMAYYYTKRSSLSNTYLFTSTYSRWALLHGHLKHKTIFLQHGWMSDKMFYLIKAGEANISYYINERQKDVCEKLLFNNKPEAHYLKGIEFNIFPDNSKINILLVCESGFRGKELKIINEIAQNKDLRLFVKPHPKDKDIDVFENLKEECGFTLILGYNFPAVDYVISYESTLAVEYEMKGVTTLVYDRDEFEEEYRRLLSMKVHHD